VAIALSLNRWPQTWVGWRWRLLAVLALVGCVVVLALIRSSVMLPQVQGQFTLSAQGQLLLVASTQAPQQPKAVRGVVVEGQVQPINAMLFASQDRWIANAPLRAARQTQQEAVNAALVRERSTWQLEDSSQIDLPTVPRGVWGVHWSFWPMIALAFLLYLAAVVVVLARPIERNAVYAAMALAQCINIGLIALTSEHGVGATLVSPLLAYQLRCLMDVATAAALVHASATHPLRMASRGWRIGGAWAAAAVISLWVLATPSAPQTWWLVQATTLVGGLLATWQWRQASVESHHPMGHVMYRLALCGTLIYLVTTVLAAVSTGSQQVSQQAAEVGATVWAVFFGIMLILLPTMARTHHLMREFALIAAASSLATALDLLFVATLATSNFASLALALFLALGLYAALRQWLMGKVLVQERFTAERTFEAVFHTAREVQQKPGDLIPQFTRLMGQLFEPLNQTIAPRALQRSTVSEDGSALWVPLPALDLRSQQSSEQALKLRFAARGKRHFVPEDALLADRVREQLTRAIVFDQAVERGRAEERARIAQDLHDDIGARLLTLMYKAPDAETEDYVRHTLKDLKTLTRGLATASHCLSHACAEWKADAQQRLMSADCELAWSFVWDLDVPLSVVQWSALTRVLRELVSNAIAHAHASHVQIEGSLELDTLRLTVADNGSGTAPENWSHGLGLGGVRKRVLQLGGRAQWLERDGGGIVCEVVVPKLSTASRTFPGSV
jgi:signal transduction histidine kinase